jgi:hypothetical protein
MEFTLDSILSVGGGVGQVSYFLRGLSMLLRGFGALRVVAILSGVAGVA